jgi:hypothetical protein
MIAVNSYRCYVKLLYEIPLACFIISIFTPVQDNLLGSILLKKNVSFVCHSGLYPESSDFGCYELRQRHWIPAFAGMTIVGVCWIAMIDFISFIGSCHGQEGEVIGTINRKNTCFSPETRRRKVQSEPV